ncbi:MAG: hypothetical protein DRP64_20720 [Verrucomicrobia bacterium]|nr:MAG: hypothetical protein DRP64_20720 [Verrucomicrobiota bacterium]
MDKQGAVHEKAEAYGIDISLIRANLRLTPTQRLRRHDQILATQRKLRMAMEKNVDDLTGIIDLLIRSNVDFVHVGGLAAVTHGSSTTTQDIETIRHLEVIQREQVVEMVF